MLYIYIVNIVILHGVDININIVFQPIYEWWRLSLVGWCPSHAELAPAGWGLA